MSRDLQVPADAVWHLMIDLDAWPKWGPTVAAARLHGAGFELGATGHVWTVVGVPLPFTITELDPGRTWAWNVAGVPATRHGVEPRDGGCRVWMSAPLWAPAYLPVLSMALRRIEEMTEAASASGVEEDSSEDFSG